ncbi:MAG: DUF72 domain-containing protein [Flavisolibacter sp.]
MKKRIHIGTSGWSYKHWRGLYYPEKLAASKWLQFYAQDFSVTEINRSFYRLPSPETIETWMHTVPKNFLFCPKMSRFLSHMKKLNDPEEPLHRFFTLFRPMKKMMGPVLVQLPEMLRFRYELAENFYKMAKTQYPEFPMVMEVRHPSWLEQDSFTLMTRFNVGFVISQSGEEFPYSEMVTAKNIYVRFHGPEELYASSYPDKILKEFARKFRKWVKQGHEVWAFFNNDIHGYATGDAKRLMAMVEN